jgi:hypothetical protein
LRIVKNLRALQPAPFGDFRVLVSARLAIGDNEELIVRALLYVTALLYVPSMTERLPSLDLIHDSFERERDRDLAHFDALDTKAGVVMGFAGVLVTIGPRDTAVAVVATAIGVAAAVAGLSAFWPGRFPALEPQHLRSYLSAEERITRLVVVDTYGELLRQGRDLIRSKALRLKAAMLMLAVASVLQVFG